MVTVHLLNKAITFLCLTGLGLSIYSYYIELNLEVDKDYEAMCDISEHMQCTKVFASSYGRGFGVIGKLFGENSVLNQPNSVSGILFYSLVGTLVQSNSLFISRVSHTLIILSNFLALYLAYILYFILYDFCVVCVSLYVVNFANLILSYSKMSKLRLQDTTKKNN